MDNFTSKTSYCCYYQAQVKRESVWFLSAILKSFEHVAFDRTIDVQESIFEFFVPAATENVFLDIMHYMQSEHIISWFKKSENRLLDSNQNV